MTNPQQIYKQLWHLLSIAPSVCYHFLCLVWSLAAQAGYKVMYHIHSHILKHQVLNFKNPCLLLSYQHSWLLKITAVSTLSEGVTTVGSI